MRRPREPSALTDTVCRPPPVVACQPHRILVRLTVGRPSAAGCGRPNWGGGLAHHPPEGPGAGEKPRALLKGLPADETAVFMDEADVNLNRRSGRGR